ncbi:MAG: SulP family inorganic anion transporter [Gammaproteobacteria bacterium]|nr:SulP family inorganic anion transporter [Gammaproteobacteria bacterium]
MPRVPKRDTLADLLAGLSIAGLLLPEAVAYSGLAGLPPQAGVLALFAGLVSYGLLGRSPFAIVTTTSSAAAVLASALGLLGAGAMAARVLLGSVLVVGCGLVFMLAGALRFGAVSSFIARPVLRGYAFGLALVIVVRQWVHMVALPADTTVFGPLLLEELRSLPRWGNASAACGLGALAALFLLTRIRRLPATLVVIIASILAAPVLAAHGVALTGPITIALGLPQFVLPAGTHWLPLTEFSLALMLILYAESYGAIRTTALRHDARVEANRDLIAIGVGNLVSGLLHGTPVGAGYSGTSANEAAGARSRLAGLSAAGVVLLCVWLLLPWIERIPRPVLAAVVIHAVSRSLSPAVFANYVRWRRDRLIAAAAVLAVLCLGVLNGLLAAIGVSLAMLLRSLARPRLAVLGRLGEHDYVNVARFPEAATRPDLMVLRPEEPLFFANVERLLGLMRERLEGAPAVRTLVLSLEESPDLDTSTLEALAEFCAWLAAHGTALRLARLKEGAREAVQQLGVTQLSGPALYYSSVDDAVRGHAVVPT